MILRRKTANKKENLHAKKKSLDPKQQFSLLVSFRHSPMVFPQVKTIDSVPEEPTNVTTELKSKLV